MPPVQQPPVSPQVPVQQPMPVEPEGKSSAEKLKHTRIIMAGLGLLALVLLITTIAFASKASTTDEQLKAQYSAGEEAGKKAQSAEDVTKASKAATSTTRTYQAPVKYGSFQIVFPKSWNIVVDSNTSEPVAGKISPDYVNWPSLTFPLRFTLVEQSYDEYKKRMDDVTKNSMGAIKKQDVTVSGIKGTQYVGKINDRDKTAVGTMVIVPLRDKTMLMQTDDNKTYGDAYRQMVAESKLIP